MIKLTRLNGTNFIVNAELIKFIEQTPDTMITLRDGEKIMVQETTEVVIQRSVQYLRSLRILPSPDR